MDTNEINQLRESIIKEYNEKIDKLKDEMNAELKALSRLSARLQALHNVFGPQKLHAGPQESIRRSAALPSSPPVSMSIGKRLNDALERMEGEFTSAQLLEAASKDGQGSEIAKTSFYPRLTKMIKRGQLIAIRQQSGGTPGLYVKALNEQTESSPAVQQGDLL